MSVQSEITRLNAAKAAIADAIAEKGVDVPDGTMLDEMGALIAAIEAGGGDTSAADALIERTATEYVSSSLKTVADYSFYKNGTITKIDCPSVTMVGSYGFGTCLKLNSVNLPLLETIGGYGFSYCSSLTEIDFPLLTTMGSSAFNNCPKLTSVNLPMVTELPNSAFKYCSELTSVNLPMVTSTNGSAFIECYVLTEIDFPLLTKIGATEFSTCKKLETVILRSKSLCALSNTSAFKSTPFASGGTGGTVYVPAALIESYKTATNWSTLYGYGTCTFAAIEGSEYE